MHNTKGDVALMNISRETSCFHDLLQHPKQKFLAFPQPQYVLRMFLHFGHFSASCSYKKWFLLKKDLMSVFQVRSTFENRAVQWAN